MKSNLAVIILCFSLSLFAYSSSRVSDNFKGEGLYTWYFLDVYSAKLWANSKKLYDDNLSLELSYLRSLKGEDIAKRSVKEMIAVGHDKLDQAKIEKTLIGIFPDVEKGDRILANYTPEKGLTFIFNGTKIIGKIADADISKKFLDIWLHKNTSGKELRMKLLGNWK